MSPEGARIGPGALIAVVGPSGAGKDTLIAHARRAFADEARVVFPARVISREPHHSEAHVTASAQALADAAAQDHYALSWEAHGLLYALPRTIDDDIRAGRVVVANLSRGAIAAARQRFTRVIVIYIDAPSALRAARLAGRGRESKEEIDSRMARQVGAFDIATADVVIVNDTTPEAAAERLAASIQASLQAKP